MLLPSNIRRQRVNPLGTESPEPMARDLAPQLQPPCGDARARECPFLGALVPKGLMKLRSKETGPPPSKGEHPLHTKSLEHATKKLTPPTEPTSWECVQTLFSGPENGGGGDRS